METIKRLVVAREKWRMNKQRIEDSQGSENTLCDIIKKDIHILHLSQLTECTTPGENTKVNYRLWVIMECQCGVNFGYTYAILVGDIDNEGDYA